MGSKAPWADLQVVELNLDEFRAALLAQSSVLTVAEFDPAVERVKAQLLKGADAGLVRIKVCRQEDIHGTSPQTVDRRRT